MSPTELAQYACAAGPDAADRPPYASSPNWMVFHVGLWAREHNVVVEEVKHGRGYNYTLNRKYRLNFSTTDTPVVSLV